MVGWMQEALQEITPIKVREEKLTTNTWDKDAISRNPHGRGAIWSLPLRQSRISVARGEGPCPQETL